MGCGSSPIPDWTNYDNSLTVLIAQSSLLSWLVQHTKLKSVVQIDFLRKCKEYRVRYASALSIPEKSGTVDIVFSSDMLGHLDRVDARMFLAECRRILRPGGFLRLSVPNLKMMAKYYLQDGDANLFLERLAFPLDKPRGFFEIIRWLLIGHRGHYWMYDNSLLCELVTSCGFIDAKVLKAGETTIPHYRKLDLSAHAGGEEVGAGSLYLEARRP